MFDKKVRYKMYKAGKNWMVAGITTVTAIMGMIAVSNGNDVHADQIQTQPATKESKDQAHAAIQGQQVKLQSSAKSTGAASAVSQDKVQAASSSAASSSSQASQESSADKSQAPAKSQTQSSQAAASSSSTKADQASAVSQSSAASTSSTKANTETKTDASTQADTATKTDAASQAQSSSQQSAQAQKKSQSQKAFVSLAAQSDSASDQTTTTVNDDRANADAKFTVHYKDHKGNTISDDTVLDFKFHRDYEVDAQNNLVKVGDWKFQSVSQSGTKIYGLENPTLTESTDQADIYGATLYAPNINNYDRDDDYQRPYTISLSKAAAAPSGLNQEFTMTYQGKAETYDVDYRVARDYRKPWNELTYDNKVSGDETYKEQGHYGDKIPFDYQAHLPEGFELVPGQNLSPELTLNTYYNSVTVWVQPVEHTSVNITLHDNTTGKDITYNNVSVNGVGELGTLAQSALAANSRNGHFKDFVITSNPFATMTALPANNTSYTVDFNENIITHDHVEHLIIPDTIQVDEGWLPEVAKLLPHVSQGFLCGFFSMDDLQRQIHDVYQTMIHDENNNLSEKEVDKEAAAKTQTLMSHIHLNSGTMVSGGPSSRFINNGDTAFANGWASGNSINVVFEVKYNCFTGQTLGVKLDPSKFTLPELKVPAGYKAQVIGLNDPFGTNGDESVKIYDSDSKVIQQGISNIIDYLNEYYYDQLGRGPADGELGLAVDSEGNLTSSDSDLLSEFADSAYQDYISAGTDVDNRVLGNKFSGNDGNYSSASDYWKYMQIILSPLLTSVYQKNFQYHQGDYMYELSDTFFTLVPEDQHVTVQYKDGDKVVNSQVFNGKTDQTITLTFDKVPANYDVDGDLPSSSYKFTADGNQVIVINLKHQTETVPESKTIKRTIKVTTPDGKTTTTVQKADLTRTNVRDKVTGDVTDGTWSTGHFDEFTVPAVAGYTPSQTKVAGEDVDGTTQNGTVNITYTANKQTGKISYVDQKTNEEIKSEPLNGVTDGDVAVKVDVPAGYHVVSGQNIPTSVKATADGVPTVTVYVAKNETPSKPVTPEKPVNPSKPTTPEKPVTPTKPSQPAEKPTTPAQKPSTPANKPAKKTSNKKNAGNSQADANRLKMLEKERKARLAAEAAKAAEQTDAEARAKARARAVRAEAARKAMKAAQAKRNAAAAQAASESRSNSLNTAQGAKAQATSETETETVAQTANANAQNTKTKNQKSGKLPQTGDQNNGEGAVVLGALAGILGLFGLGADRKRRRD